MSLPSWSRRCLSWGLLAFACLASKSFNRYVVYYGAQSVALSFAAGTAAIAFHSTELRILVMPILATKGLRSRWRRAGFWSRGRKVHTGARAAG